jgi:hypothetical protein
MNATFLKRWTTWLLPLIVLRAFVPVGFMLGAGTEGLQLVFCPSVSDPSATHPTESSAATEHAQHGENHAGSHNQHENAPCPYGLIGAAACIAAACADVGHVARDEAVELPATPLLSRSPSGTERIRGPPLFSLEA